MRNEHPARGKLRQLSLVTERIRQGGDTQVTKQTGLGGRLQTNTLSQVTFVEQERGRAPLSFDTQRQQH